ncbi:MAG: hypothetical protein ACK2UQ_17755, partial [Anaerolineae bacterium]
AQFDITVERSATHYRVEVTSTEDFQMRIGAYLPAVAHIVEVRLNDQPVAWHREDILAGHCIVCEAMTPAVLCVHYGMV